MSSLINFSYFPEELIKFNNLWFFIRNVWNSIHQTILNRCFTIFIDLFVSTRNCFSSSVHKTLVNENILSMEYPIIVVKFLIGMSIFSIFLNILHHPLSNRTIFPILYFNLHYIYHINKFVKKFIFVKFQFFLLFLVIYFILSWTSLQIGISSIWIQW